MTISSPTYSPAPPVQRPDSARVQKDNSQIGTAQRTRDNAEAQKAVATLRKDAPAPRPQPIDRDGDNDATRETQKENGRIGSTLNAKA